MQTIQEVTQQGVEQMKQFRMSFALEMARVLLKGADGRYPSLVEPSLIQAKAHIARYYEIKNS